MTRCAICNQLEDENSPLIAYREDDYLCTACITSITESLKEFEVPDELDYWAKTEVEDTNDTPEDKPTLP